MQRFTGILVAATLAASAAHAGPLASASLELIGSSTWPVFVIEGSGVIGSAGSNTSATLAAGSGFAANLKRTPNTSAAPPITWLTLTIESNEAGSFTGASPGSVRGAAEFVGIFKATGFGGLTLLGVPLGLGAPGTSTFAKSGVQVTAVGASWTVGTAAVTGLSGTATVATMMGANGLTPGGVGTLVLVTPVKVITNIAGTLPIFGRLTLQYVPEPATGVLLALGCAGLAGAGGLRRGHAARGGFR